MQAAGSGNLVTHNTQNFVVAWVREAIQEMSDKNGAIPLSPLKGLQRKLENALNVNLGEEDLFFVFFLATFIQDVFYNLAGDVPYSERSEQEKQKVYSELASDLGQFAEAMEQGEPSKKLHSCMQLVNTYLNGVKAINLVLKEEL